MLSKSVSCFIAIIISTKSCVTSHEFPTVYLKSILPNLNSSLLTKPIQSLYHTPTNAVNLLQRVNPLNYFVTFPSHLQNLKSMQNYGSKSSKSDKYNIKTEIPNIQNVLFHNPSFPHNKQMESVNSDEVYGATQTEITPISYIVTQKMPKYNLETLPSLNISTGFNHFMKFAEKLDRKFYQVSFHKLLSISPPERHENGISFAQSGLFLYLELMALCTESDEETVAEIKKSLGLKTTCAEQVHILKGILSSLPKSDDFLKFRWSSRLVLGPKVKIGENFLGQTAPALHVHLDRLDKTGTTEQLTHRLNHMIDADSGWAMHDTLEEDELSDGVCAAWLTTMYLRARWRSAPTALNGSWLFYDGAAPARSVRMIRINDVMRYVYLEEWDAEAIEIRYAAPELTLVILMPRGRSLRKLSERVSTENLHIVYEKMYTKRIAVTLPIYTLRMTLLLPGKLQMMGLSRLVDSQAGGDCQTLKISHAIQRIMFWAEAGRNAFKDDGIEWDEAPELERVLDRPYIFFVRWRNITLLNGNFVL